MNEDKMTRQKIDGAWIVYMDAFGFSAAVERHSDTTIDNFFSEIYERLEQSSRSITAAYQFSDSIFLIQRSSPDPHARLNDLRAEIQHLQRIALQYGLAFRGAVTFGTVFIGPFGCYGQPVVDAARLEAHLAAPLVVLPERYIIKASEYLRREYSSSAWLELDTQIIKTKTGSLLANLIAQPDRLFVKVAHAKIRESLLYGPDHLASAWQTAIAALNLSNKSE